MDKPENTFMDWLRWSEEHWADWLDKKLNERKQVFRISPDDLVGSFNREKSHARDYHGRELLELVQNADDSGVGYCGKHKKLLIRLTDFGLLVANTGVPFSPEGIASLIVSDNSPKQFLGSKCIGYKGLGFRSVLGWSSSVVVLSGNLSVGFNDNIAAKWLQLLREENPNLDDRVKQFEAKGINNPVATLSVPRILRSGDEFGEQELKNLYDEGKKILANGYDTVICLLFKNPDRTKVQVQQQINSLGSEILLFLQFLESIEIESSERKDVWLVKREENQIIVNPHTQNPKTWKIFSSEGVIPPEKLRPEQVLNNKYEIKVALSESPADINRLFVFFPTEVRFPFPLIAHATFEVTDNRQHLIDSDANRFIAGKLAELMVKAAESIKNFITPWYALSTVSPYGDIDSVLESLDFLNRLKEEIKQRELLPVRSNSFKVVGKVKIIKGNFDSLLMGEVFSDICIYTDNIAIANQLAKLGVTHIEYGDLKIRLDKISDALLLDLRVDIIYALINNGLINGVSPELLIDEEGNKISSENSIFLPPEKKIFPLPSWISQKILSSEFTARLKERFGVSSIRDLYLKMKDFNVQEYNMNSLVHSIVAETNRRAKDVPDDELNLRIQMIQAIWNIYSSSSDRVKLRDEITVILSNRCGKFNPAKNLYLGKEYHGGNILEYLYAHIDPELFVASAEALGFSDANQEVEDFLCWLGVNNAPKHIEINLKQGNFLDYAMSCLTYPAKFQDVIIDNMNEFKKCYCSLEKVLSVDRLEEVIRTVDPHAVICWIATNPEIESWRINGDTNAIFWTKQPSQFNSRRLLNQHIPSYVLWLLRNVAWLPVSGGNKLAPYQCSLARGTKDLEPIIGFPAIDMNHPLVKALNLDLPAIRNALIKIGVVTDLDEVSWDSFYEVLLELPKLDPEGNKAKSFYRALLGRNDMEIVPSGDKYEEFMSKGKMLGKMKGKIAYYPVGELYYVDNITLPFNITGEFPLLEVDKRRGAAKVKKIFGVEQLTRDRIKIEVIHFEEHNVSQSFQGDFERLKPYIYALRVEEDTNRVNLSALKRLEIKLCKSVRVAVEINSEKREIDLEEGDSVNIDTIAYLVSGSSDYSQSFLKDEIIADTLGEIVSNILKVDVNNEIARLASCSASRRDLLLNKIVGGSGNERLMRAKDLLKTSDDSEEGGKFSKPAFPWSPPPKPAEESPRGEGEKEAEREGSRQGEVGNILTREVEIPSSSQKKKVVARIIRRNPDPSRLSHVNKRIDPDRAESLALRFEESQGRYPVKVSHIRGFEAYGCDILSFVSEEASSIFRQNGNPDLVDRFIEVKGSSNEKGSVALGGNELTSAQRYREKFFIYRIYEDVDTGLFELVSLGNPLDTEKEAFEIRYEINLFHANKSHMWEVEEQNEES